MTQNGVRTLNAQGCPGTGGLDLEGINIDQLIHVAQFQYFPTFSMKLYLHTMLPVPLDAP